MDRVDDYYSILGVGRTAGDEEIRAAYRTKIAELNGTGLSEVEKIARVKLLADAFVVLGDVDKRWAYNKYGRVFDEDAGDPVRYHFTFGGIASIRTLLIGIVSSALISWSMVSQVKDTTSFTSALTSGPLFLARSLSEGQLFAWAFATCFVAWAAGLLVVVCGLLLLLHVMRKRDAGVGVRHAVIGYYLLLLVVLAPARRLFVLLFFNCVATASSSDYYASGLFALVDTIWLVTCIFSYESVVWHKKPRSPAGSLFNFLVFALFTLVLPVVHLQGAMPYISDYAVITLMRERILMNFVVFLAGLVFYGFVITFRDGGNIDID